MESPCSMVTNWLSPGFIFFEFRSPYPPQNTQEFPLNLQKNFPPSPVFYKVIYGANEQATIGVARLLVEKATAGIWKNIWEDHGKHSIDIKWDIFLIEYMRMIYRSTIF